VALLRAVDDEQHVTDVEISILIGPLPWLCLSTSTLTPPHSSGIRPYFSKASPTCGILLLLL
jgi:hypothetical protein